jgi:hypothetical protein
VPSVEGLAGDLDAIMHSIAERREALALLHTRIDEDTAAVTRHIYYIKILQQLIDDMKSPVFYLEELGETLRNARKRARAKKTVRAAAKKSAPRATAAQKKSFKKTAVRR